MRKIKQYLFHPGAVSLIAAASRAVMVCMITVLLFVAAMFSSCKKESGRDIKTDAQTKQKASPTKADKKVARPPLAGAAFRMLGPEVLGGDAASREIKELQKRGIMKISLPCDREGMCMRMDYGAAVGFEVELLRRLSNEGLGVKENIVPPNAADADLKAAYRCGGAGEAPDLKNSPSGNPVAGPYYYSARRGWLCFEVLRGGRPVADALDRVIAHFYNTGTFQQVYRNWFPPDEPDAVRAQ